MICVNLSIIFSVLFRFCCCNWVCIHYTPIGNKDVILISYTRIDTQYFIEHTFSLDRTWQNERMTNKIERLSVKEKEAKKKANGRANSKCQGKCKREKKDEEEEEKNESIMWRMRWLCENLNNWLAKHVNYVWFNRWTYLNQIHGRI